VYNGVHLKEKLYKTNAATWFNKLYKIQQLTAKYMQVTVNENYCQSINTKNAVNRYCLNQELKYLHKKKQALNEQLYKAHLECASQW
jgi:hypothetical protein